MLYMVIFTINIPQMLACIPYMGHENIAQVLSPPEVPSGKLT